MRTSAASEHRLDRLVRLLCPWKRPKRLDLRFVDYAEGDRLVRKGWTIAREEDRNKVLGMVWLELLEGAKCQSCKNGYNGTNGNGYQPCGCEQPNARNQADRPAQRADGRAGLSC